MRLMLVPVLLVLCCLPLRAGDPGLLDQAIRSFASDTMAERDAATLAVRIHLQRELAPLLLAMKSKDPEVSRRAREAIASLLPPGAEQQGAPVTGAPQGMGWVQFVRVQGGNQVVWVGGPNGVWQVHGAGQRHMQRVRKFGLNGYACTQGLLRRQLGLAAGRGFVVSKLTPRSVASQLGLRVHDIILAIDGKPVMQPASLFEALGVQTKWAGLKVRVMRNGKVTTLSKER